MFGFRRTEAKLPTEKPGHRGQRRTAGVKSSLAKGRILRYKLKLYQAVSGEFMETAELKAAINAIVARVEKAREWL